MKKIFIFAMMAVLAMGALTSCEDDYADATSPHEYSESENPPLKGSDATNLVSSSVKMRQAEAGREVSTTWQTMPTRYSRRWASRSTRLSMV